MPSLDRIRDLCLFGLLADDALSFTAATGGVLRVVYASNFTKSHDLKEPRKVVLFFFHVPLAVNLVI